MYIGIDLGTSAIKCILIDNDGRVIATASEPLQVSRPKPGHSEQDPESWGKATSSVIDAIEKVTRFNRQRFGAATNEKNYPTVAARRAFVRQIQQWLQHSNCRSRPC